MASVAGPTLYDQGAYERIEPNAADMHEQLVDALGVSEGERWLDVATGTGAVAFLAARRGAQVTAQDLSSRLIEIAAARPEAAELSITFEVGDCQALPYADATFDVVSSSIGAIFAPDHKAVACELSRVVRPGGRLGFTAWRAEGVVIDMRHAQAPFLPPPPAGTSSPFEWGHSEYVSERLGDSCALEFIEGDSPIRAESPAALVEELVTSFPPVVATYGSLSADRQVEMRTALQTCFQRYRQPDGRVVASRPYLLVVATRATR